MLAFPPLLALATTNPMCLFKIPMKLKVDPSKMPKLAGKQKKLEQKWGTHKDKAMRRKEQLEGKLSDAEAAGEWGSVISGEDISVSGLEGEEAEAVGEATSLSLAFMGATTPKGVIVFLWEMFKLVADKAGIAELQTFAESEDMNLIFFLMMLFWDGICGQFATAIMSIVTQLIFCNCGFCDNSCEVSQFDFRNKPENLELTAPPPTLEDTKNDANKPATTTMSNRFLFHPTADTCSVTRTVQNHEEFGFWWQEVRFFFYYFIICLNCHFLVTTKIILLTSLLMFSCSSIVFCFCSSLPSRFRGCATTPSATRSQVQPVLRSILRTSHVHIRTFTTTLKLERFQDSRAQFSMVVKHGLLRTLATQ